MDKNLNTSKWHSWMHSRWLLPVVALLLVLASWTSLFDAPAERDIDRAIVHAAAIYATARGINGAVSVVQSGNFSVGVISGSPGELLDPLNDMIERFSEIMTFALSSLVLQKILLVIVKHSLFSFLLTVAALAYVAAVALRMDWRATAGKALASLVVIRFALAFIVLANTHVSAAFLDHQIYQYEKGLKLMHSDITALATMSESPEQGNPPPVSPEDIQEKITAANQQLVDLRNDKIQLAVSIKDLETDLANLQAKSGCPWWKEKVGFCEETTATKERRAEITALQTKLDEAQAKSDAAEDKLQELTKQHECAVKHAKGEKCSFTEWVKGKLEGLNPKQAVERFNHKTEAFFKDAIDLLTLEILKCILFPLAFWYGLYKVLGLIWRKQSDATKLLVAHEH